MKRYACLALALGLVGALALTGCSDKSAAGTPPPMATGTGTPGGKLDLPKGTVSGDPAKKGAGSDKDKSAAPPPPMSTGGDASGKAGGPPGVKPAGTK